MKSTLKNYTRFRLGMTLIEITVVILVLLSFIGTLLVGTRAWINHSDRSASIITIRNAQQAVRGYANTVGQIEGSRFSTKSRLEISIMFTLKSFWIFKKSK